MNSSDHAWWDAVNEATAVGQKYTATREEFDQGCDHIVQLIKDVDLLLNSGSYGSAVFLAITALEETAKIYVGMFRYSKEPVLRRKDPLFKHDEKHYLAISPFIRSPRLQKAIGEQRLEELIIQAGNGGFIQIRESALYSEKRNGQLKRPYESITENMAREFLLLSIAVFDDRLVCNTAHTFELAMETEQIFSKWENIK